MDGLGLLLGPHIQTRTDWLACKAYYYYISELADAAEGTGGKKEGQKEGQQQSLFMFVLWARA